MQVPKIGDFHALIFQTAIYVGHVLLATPDGSNARFEWFEPLNNNYKKVVETYKKSSSLVDDNMYSFSSSAGVLSMTKKGTGWAPKEASAREANIKIEKFRLQNKKRKKTSTKKKRSAETQQSENAYMQGNTVKQKEEKTQDYKA